MEVRQFVGTIFEDGFGMIPQRIMRDRKLSSNGKVVYSYLTSYAWNTIKVYPKQKTMADDLGISEEKLRKSLNELYDLGYVQKEKYLIPEEKRTSPKQRYRNMYILTNSLKEIVEVKDKRIEASSESTENIDEFEPPYFEGVQNEGPQSEAPQNKGVNNKRSLVIKKDLLIKELDDDRSIVEDSKKKESQSELLKECYELISKATGLNLERVKMCIASNLLWQMDLQELISAFYKSKYLKGLADKKVPISTFGSMTQLNKVIGGFYEDRPEAKGKGGKSSKPPKGPCVIKNQGQDHSEIVEGIKGTMTDLERFKSEVTKKILKSGNLKLMANLTPLKTLDQIQEFIQRYDL